MTFETSAYVVYDVTRRDTFTNLSDIWAKEIDLYSTNQDCIKMLVGNKVDKARVLFGRCPCLSFYDFGTLFDLIVISRRVNELFLKKKA